MHRDKAGSKSANVGSSVVKIVFTLRLVALGKSTPVDMSCWDLPKVGEWKAARHG